MHSLPLLDQNAHPVKAFDEAGCQTSPSLPEHTLPSESSTQFHFMSFEDLDNILLGLDATATSIRDDVAAAPPAYSDAVTHTDPSSALGLGLDRSTLVSSPPIRTSTAMPVCVNDTVLRRPDDDFARPQKIDHLLNPVPPGIYMCARPMIWDSTSSAATACEAQRLVNEARLPQSSAHPDPTRSGLPPWRRPSIAHVAFQTALMSHSDVFGRYQRSPGPAPQFDSVPRYHLSRSLTYPPPPKRHISPYKAPDARIDPWLEHIPSWDTYVMPGSYPPSPSSTNTQPSYDFPDTCCSTARCHSVQREGSLLRHTSSVYRGFDSCYPSPPPSPSSSVSTDSAYSSPGSSPGFDLHLSLHTTPHSSSALPHRSIESPTHAMHLSMPPPPSSPTQQQPSVVNISIALPPPCASPHQDWLCQRISSLCTILVPLVFLVPVGVYVFNTILPSSRPPSSLGASASLLHGPLVWRALSSVLSYVFRTMKDADVKI